MPPNPIREDALTSIDTKRFHTEGAALFAVLPQRREPSLLRLLVVYELLWDFLDCVSERPCEDIVLNGLQLHLAFAEALDPGAAISDYYRHHPWNDDGGYLRAMVEACRRGCLALPSYSVVRPLALREAARARVVALNHDPDPARRDARLAAWAEQEFPGMQALHWFELTAASSSSVALHALLVLAADPHCDEEEIAATYAAYFPWVNFACIMLDSLVDLPEDLVNGEHSYIGHYPDLEAAGKRLGEVVRVSRALVAELPRGARHELIVTGMVAMYLSKDGEYSAAGRAAGRRILRAPGPLPTVLWPILRVWRRIRQDP